MNLIIFSCSPKPKDTSNTAAIAGAFRDGFLSQGNQGADVYYLYKRSEWENYRKIFDTHTEIIFAMPLFVECVPGLVMEFLESLTPKKKTDEKTKIGFILQSGFQEAHQLRTCEKFLEKLPSYLNCEYSGTLLKGGMFTLSLVSDAKRKKRLKSFVDMGKRYANERVFEKSAVTKFAAPEKYSTMFCLLVKIFMPITNFAWNAMARNLSVNAKLNARPYATF